MSEESISSAPSSMKNTAKSSARNSAKNALILALFALVTTGLTTLTWLLTKDRIETEKELALLRAISELVPASRYANDPYRDCTLITDEALLGNKDQHQAWRLRDSQGDAVAVLISSVAPSGYNGAINIIVGHYLESQTLAGVRVTSHNETPGLGDKIEVRKNSWILQFSDLASTQSSKDFWQVKKDGGNFDAFTGATITPRAVLRAIDNNIQYFKQHQKQLFLAPSNCLVDESQQQDQSVIETQSTGVQND